jgi:integrase
MRSPQAVSPRVGRAGEKSDYDDWTRLLQSAMFACTTAGILLLTENVHPRVITELLGHSRMRTTMAIYSDAMPGLVREAPSC